MSQADIRRRKQLAAIHAARRDLGMDDDSYRLMLREVAGVASAADLTAGGRRTVLDHLRSVGWQAKPRKRVAQHPGTPHNLEREPLLQKIEAQLADMGLSWAYADAIARRQTGVERVAWLRKIDDLRAVVAALAVEQEKRSLIAQVDERLKVLGWDRQTLVERAQTLPKGWERNRRTLRALVKRLDGLTAEQSHVNGGL